MFLRCHKPSESKKWYRYRREAFADKSDIIKVQEEVIKKNWEQIKEISLTVQTEMKRTAYQL